MHNQLDQLLQDRAHLRYYAHMLALPRSLADVSSRLVCYRCSDHHDAPKLCTSSLSTPAGTHASAQAHTAGSTQAAYGYRVWQGLAYSIGGGWNTSPIDHPGLFVAGGATASPAELLQVLGDSLQVHL